MRAIRLSLLCILLAMVQYSCMSNYVISKSTKTHAAENGWGGRICKAWRCKQLTQVYLHTFFGSSSSKLGPKIWNVTLKRNLKKTTLYLSTGFENYIFQGRNYSYGTGWISIWKIDLIYSVKFENMIIYFDNYINSQRLVIQILGNRMILYRVLVVFETIMSDKIFVLKLRVKILNMQGSGLQGEISIIVPRVWPI